MSALRNILQKCVWNASILGRTQLCLQHSGNFCPIFSSTYISRKAYSKQHIATHSAQESSFGKTSSTTTQPSDIPDEKKAAKISLFNQMLNLRKYSRMFLDFFSADAPSSNKNLNLRKYFINILNLSKETTPESLREFYSQFGEIASCRIYSSDLSQSKPNQVGIVALSSEEAKVRALNSSPHCIDGKQIKIKPTILSKTQLTLQVLDLAPETTPESLKAFYSKFGMLNDCKMKKKTYGKVGNVTFAYQEDMHRALDAQPHVIDESEVLLKYATYDLDLQIRKIPEDTTEETLRAFYSKYGQLRQCRLFKSKAGVLHAFVSYSAVNEVNRAISDRPHIIDGKPLQITLLT